jgi:hypothetical protein
MLWGGVLSLRAAEEGLRDGGLLLAETQRMIAITSRQCCKIAAKFAKNSPCCIVAIAAIPSAPLQTFSNGFSPFHCEAGEGMGMGDNKKERTHFGHALSDNCLLPMSRDGTQPSDRARPQ